jgi:signal transduction histidine kinase
MNGILIVLFPTIAVFTLISIAIAGWESRKRAARWFATFAFVLAIEMIAWGLEASSYSLAVKLFWNDVQWYGFIVSRSLFLLFVLIYVDAPLPQRRFSQRILLINGVLLALLLAIGSASGQLRGDPLLIETDGLFVLEYVSLPIIGGLAAFGSMVGIISIAQLIRMWAISKQVYRRQTLLIIAALLVNLFGGLLTHVGVRVFGVLLPVLFTNLIAVLLIGWALFRYRLFNLVPVARALVFENMSDAVIVVDQAGQIVDLNPAAAALLPTPALALGQTMAAAFAHWGADAVRHFDAPQATMARLSQRLAVAGEVQHFYALTIVPLTDSDHHLRGRVYTLRDVTPLVEAEEQLRKRTRDLEVANDALQRERASVEQARIAAETARDQALQADEIKSQFLASMSHELRTPLNAILNFTEFVSLGMMGPVNERQKDALDKALDGARHLLNLINDVLDIAKIEAGMMRLFVEDNIDLCAELNAVIATTQTLLRDKPVQFVHDIDADLPRMVGDRRRIRQIMLNLLANAAKFTETGSITLSVKRRPDEVVFAVIDTGPGIARADQTTIFEPFQQTEYGIQHMNGTGLGLPITKRLVEAHNGRLWLESELGEGAAFFVSLPIRHPELVAQIEPFHPVHA